MRRWQHWLGIGVIALGVMPFGAAQIRPDAPVISFRLPGFSETGYIAWELRGAEARYVSENEIRVRDLELTTYSGLEDLEVRARILSPRAILYPNDSRASGPGSLRVETGRQEITGENWSWESETQTLIVREQARVRFEGGIGSLIE